MITVIMGARGSGRTAVASGLARQLLNWKIMELGEAGGVLVLDNLIEDGVDVLAQVLDLHGVPDIFGNYPYSPRGVIRIPNIIKMMQQYKHTIITVTDTMPKNFNVDRVIQLTKRAA